MVLLSSSKARLAVVKQRSGGSRSGKFDAIGGSNLRVGVRFWYVHKLQRARYFVV